MNNPTQEQLRRAYGIGFMQQLSASKNISVPQAQGLFKRAFELNAQAQKRADQVLEAIKPILGAQ